MSFIRGAIIGALVFLASCAKDDRVRLISSPAAIAESVYLTHDEKDNPVVVWTERDRVGLTLCFATSHDNGRSFAQKVTLPLSSDVATHAESMPKVAFQADGTIIAAYEKKTPTKDNKYAAVICYVVSDDRGKSWTREAFLHSDTVAGRSRSYFDIERLPDGEVGAAWLDIKLSQETGGRSVRFARTSGGNAFSNEILVDSSACQCCRIDIYSDITGKVNVAYRGLMKGNMGRSIRDMMIATSNDKGRSFKAPLRISQDNWEIDGCPHTGPSLCSNKAGLFSMWYTEGNGTGLYYSFKGNGDNAFGERQAVSPSGRHPQVSANTTRFLMVWEENQGADENNLTKVVFQTNDENSFKKDVLSPEDANAYLPVVRQVSDGFLVAFLMERNGEVGVYFAKL